MHTPWVPEKRPRRSAAPTADYHGKQSCRQRIRTCIMHSLLVTRGHVAAVGVGIEWLGTWRAGLMEKTEEGTVATKDATEAAAKEEK